MAFTSAEKVLLDVWQSSNFGKESKVSQILKRDKKVLLGLKEQEKVSKGVNSICHKYESKNLRRRSCQTCRLRPPAHPIKLFRTVTFHFPEYAGHDLKKG
jgi:glyceraldehyde-3-phosphate dehydrogenase/erythrose-4-phosphate dehydrogenase